MGIRASLGNPGRLTDHERHNHLAWFYPRGFGLDVILFINQYGDPCPLVAWYCAVYPEMVIKVKIFSTETVPLTHFQSGLFPAIILF